MRIKGNILQFVLSAITTYQAFLQGAKYCMNPAGNTKQDLAGVIVGRLVPADCIMLVEVESGDAFV